MTLALVLALALALVLGLVLFLVFVVVLALVLVPLMMHDDRGELNHAWAICPVLALDLALVLDLVQQ